MFTCVGVAYGPLGPLQGLGVCVWGGYRQILTSVHDIEQGKYSTCLSYAKEQFASIASSLYALE